MDLRVRRTAWRPLDIRYSVLQTHSQQGVEKIYEEKKKNEKRGGGERQEGWGEETKTAQPSPRCRSNLWVLSLDTHTPHTCTDSSRRAIHARAGGSYGTNMKERKKRKREERERGEGEREERREKSERNLLICALRSPRSTL